MTDLVAHLTRQAAFSRATFGPGARTKGVCDHIRKELEEVEAFQTEDDRAHEWVDVAILALDGLTRSIAAYNPTMALHHVALRANTMILQKQAENELRRWPDWRTADPDKAIEHDRTDDGRLATDGEF
jgi:hypothetical protein